MYVSGCCHQYTHSNRILKQKGSYTKPHIYIDTHITCRLAGRYRKLFKSRNQIKTNCTEGRKQQNKNTYNTKYINKMHAPIFHRIVMPHCFFVNILFCFFWTFLDHLLRFCPFLLHSFFLSGPGC